MKCEICGKKKARYECWEVTQDGEMDNLAPTHEVCEDCITIEQEQFAWDLKTGGRAFC